MKKYSLILACALCFTACHSSSVPSDKTDADSTQADDSPSEDLIIGGRIVTKRSEIATTTVSLLDTAQGTLCTASILSDSVAVTAAHCVDGDPNDKQLSFGLRSGGHDMRPVVDMAASPTWALHQQQEFNNGDIALVRFSGGLPAGSAPAMVMKASQHLSDGEIVTLAGFGISNGDGEGAGKLRMVDVKIAKARYSQTEVSLDQRNHKGACHGDSGGPAFVQDSEGGLLLWGVTSRGIDDPTDHCVGESVYTRIQPYSKWINQVVRRWSAKK